MSLGYGRGGGGWGSEKGPGTFLAADLGEGGCTVARPTPASTAALYRRERGEEPAAILILVGAAQPHGTLPNSEGVRTAPRDVSCIREIL